MAIQVNSLIQRSMQKCSLVGDGQNCSGTQVRAALEDLKSVIAKLNEQNLILQDVKVLDSFVSDKITFAKKPDNWFEYDTFDEMTARIDNHLIGDIVHIKEAHDGFNFYSLTNHNSVKTWYSLPEWNNMMKEAWPTHFVEELPDRVSGVGRWIANRYVQLYPADKIRIDSQPKVGLATEYCVETENLRIDPINAPEYGNTVTYLKIEMNARTPAKMRVTYLEQIPDIKIEDTLYISNMYETLLEDGLCAELCLRYKLLEVREKFENEFDNSIRLIKRTNNANRPMTYDFIDKGSYMDNYYNGFSPVQWC